MHSEQHFYFTGMGGKARIDWLSARDQAFLPHEGDAVKRITFERFHHILGANGITKSTVHTHLWKPTLLGRVMGSC